MFVSKVRAHSSGGSFIGSKRKLLDLFVNILQGWKGLLVDKKVYLFGHFAEIISLIIKIASRTAFTKTLR
jgi:hypothetical protein